jgi:putative phage repressor
MDIGKNIRARRKELKMTLEQLALEVGSDTGNLSRIERGQQEITIGKIEVFAKALNCSALDLVNPKNEDAPPSLPQGYQRIPLLTDAQAKDWLKLKEHLDFFEIDEWLIIGSEISKDAFCYQINDASMKPDFKVGDRVIIDPQIAAEAGDYVLATDANHSVVFRKYRARGAVNGKDIFDLAPLNDDYPVLSAVNEALFILGVMVEHRKYRQR